MDKVELNALCTRVVAAAKAEFPDEKMGDDDMSMTVGQIDRAKGTEVFGSYKGDLGMYPASVVKLFYLGYAAHLLDTGKRTLSEEAKRAAHDMIVDSNNDATGYMVDWICGTTPGPELDAKDFKAFEEKRYAVNRWYESLGFTGINACNRTFNEGPYGRETQLLGPKYEHRNWLTSDACAHLMADIALGKHWGKAQTAWMHSLLHRANPADDPKNADGQARAYTGKVIPPGTVLHSKAGWTSDVRHDVAWLTMPDGKEFVISIFTKRGGNTKIVSWAAAQVLMGLGYKPRDPMVEVE